MPLAVTGPVTHELMPRPAGRGRFDQRHFRRALVLSSTVLRRTFPIRACPVPGMPLPTRRARPPATYTPTGSSGSG
jgi:hypothetical protein